MPEFKLRKLKGELFEILGLEAYLEKKLGRLKAASPKALELKPAVALVEAKKPKRGAVKEDPSLAALEGVLAKHPRKAELLRAGTQKDQLLRSLVPLYLARSGGVEVNSGLISRFWKAHGVVYATSNAAKALREHAAYSKQTKTGRQISSEGVKYVESAVGRKAA